MYLFLKFFLSFFYFVRSSVKNELSLNRSIPPIDRTLMGTTTTPAQSGAGSNSNERVLQNPQIFRMGTSP